MGVLCLDKQTAQIVNESVFSRGSVIKGTVLSYIATLVLFVIFAIILTFADFPDKFVQGAVIITTVISLLLGGTVAGRSARSMGWASGLIMGTLYMVILYVLGGIINRNFTVDSNMLILFCIGIVSGAIGGMIGINIKMRQRPYRKY